MSGYFPRLLAVIYIPDYTRQRGKNQFLLGYSACNSAVRHVTQNLDNDYLRGPTDICKYPLLIGHADGYSFCDRISCAIDQENYHNSLGNDVSKILQNKFEDKHSCPSNRM